ncbi:hypothetical protein KFL_001140230 [Klebsormidium nitens]|uniref:Uncharacterized protein n=1 Tax=Klebsormidium nitens TaxID=105231 RepID=A0A1Y1HV83_KLENI|nr:hypothetical protein KFL_001140230 [Klebsormidium nitens]|eukprot:GAQ82535.1 hypothetical protein KFL_001140230 [Klebsormidium nitens]
MDEITAILEHVTGEVRKKFQEMSDGGSIKDSILAFVHAVDWTEPWILALICAHMLLFFVAIFTRRRNNLQFVLFFTILATIYFAETINKLAGKHWKQFSRQHYFDPQGVFISVIFSGPLILISLILLVNSLYNLTQLIIEVKRAELRVRSKQQAAEDKKVK